MLVDYGHYTEFHHDVLSSMEKSMQYYVQENKFKAAPKAAVEQAADKTLAKWDLIQQNVSHIEFLWSFHYMTPYN
jgi:hypothetical protein